jgi:hypothetical protein
MKKTLVRNGIVVALLAGAFAAQMLAPQAAFAQNTGEADGYTENAAGETGTLTPLAPASGASEKKSAPVPAPAAAASAAAKPPASIFEWSAGGKAIWAPVIMQGGNVYDDTGSITTDSNGVPEYENNLWVGSGPGEEDIGAIVGIRVKGQNAAGSVGMDLQLGVDVGSLTSHNVIFAKDNIANAWAKPFGNEWLTVRGGLFLVDDLRGKVGTVNENFFFPGSHGGDNNDIFDRFNSGGRFGFHIKSSPLTAIRPLAGLQLHAAFGVNDSAALDYNKNDRAEAWKEVFEAAQYGLGYKIGNYSDSIGDIGFIRFQYLGGSYGKTSLAQFLGSTKRWEQVQFALQVTAVKNLNLDVGMKVPFKIDGDSDAQVNHLVPINGKDQILFDDDVYQPPMTARIAGNYNFGVLGLSNLDLHLAFKVGFSEKLEYTRATEISWERPYTFGFDFEPSWQLGTIGKIYGNLAMTVQPKSTTTDAGVSSEEIDDTTDLAVGISFHRNLGGGNFSIGFYGNFPVAGEGYSDISNGLAKAQAFKIAVPITVSYSL